MIKPPRPGWYSLAATLGTSLLTAILTLVIALQMGARSAENEREARITAIALVEAQRVEALRVLNAQRQETDRQWCELITTFTDVYRRKPPPTETGKLIAARMNALRVSLQCP